MRKKIILLMAILMVGILGACGQGDTGNSDAEDQTLSILVEGGSPAHEVAKKTADEFEELTGYKIEIDSVPYTGVFEKLKTEIQAGKAIHDVAIIDVLWFSSVENGLEPLDDVLTEEETNDFLPQLKESGTLNGQLLGIPTWTNSKVLLYRKDLFEDEGNQEAFKNEYGYELTVPTNWQEYTDAAEFFAKDGMYGASVFGQTGGDAVSSWLDHAAQAGAKGLIIDDNGTVNINSKPYKESLSFLRTLIEKGTVPEDYLTIASSETAELFNDGKLAMQIAWGHFFLSSNEALEGKVGAAPMIAGDQGIGAVPGPWYQVVLKDSNKKDIAKDYLKFMYDKNEMYMEELGVAARASVFEKYLDDEAYEHVKAIQETLDGPQTQNRPQTDKWNIIENEVLSPMLQRVLDGADIEAELENAEVEIESHLK